MADQLQHNSIQPQIRLQSFTNLECAELLPVLTRAIDVAGGWILNRRTLSTAAVELSVELQVPVLPEIYGALLGCGLQLTRDSHYALAERCTCNLHLRPRRGTSSYLLLRLQIHFPPEPPGTLAPVQR